MVNIQDNPAFQQGVSAEAGNVEIVAFSAGVLPVEQQTAVRLERQSGVEIDPAEESTLESVLTALQGTLTVTDDGTLSISGTTTVQEDTALDVSGATVTVTQQDPVAVSGVVSVQEDTAVDVSAATVDVQEETPLDVSAATVSVQEDTPLDVSAATVTVTQDSPVALQSVSGQSVSDTTTQTGQANAATVTVPDGRTHVELFVDTTGAATLTFETSPDGQTFFQRETISISAASTQAFTRQTGASQCRVFVDQNLTEATLQAKGT